MQIKIFEGCGNNENEINDWLKENPNIKVSLVTLVPMHDYYSNITPLQICNQWIATTVIYETNTIIEEKFNGRNDIKKECLI